LETDPSHHSGYKPMPIETYVMSSLERIVERCCNVLEKFIPDKSDSAGMTAFYTRGIFLGTLLYVACTVGLWIAQLENNKVQLQALQSVQRAIVSFKDFTYDRIADPDHPTTQHRWDFTATFKNAGKTTAQEAISFFDIQQLPREPDERQFIGNPRLQT